MAHAHHLQENKKVSINKSKKKINLIKSPCIDNKDINSFKQFTKKCDILKERASKILNDFINLSDYINYSKK